MGRDAGIKDLDTSLEEKWGCYINTWQVAHFLSITNIRNKTIWNSGLEDIHCLQDLICYSKVSADTWNVPLRGPVSALLVRVALPVFWGCHRRPCLLPHVSPLSMISTNSYPAPSSGKFLTLYSTKSILPGNKQLYSNTSHTQWGKCMS